MAKALNKRQVDAISEPGLYRVADNLYFQHKNGGRSWILRYQLDGKARQFGLGPYRLVGFDEAKRKAVAILTAIYNGADPLEERRRAKAAKGSNPAKVPSMKECAEKYISAHEDSWKNPKHRAQWESTIATYANPVLGHLTPEEVTVQHLLQVLQPIWTRKPETAGRLRGRLEKIIGWATAQGYRSGDNPAAWRGGALSHLLPPLARIQSVEHHGATPYADVPKLVARLREQNSTSARALLFTILTAARTGETIGANPEEIGPEAIIWTVPAERMKAGKLHQVPLVGLAAAIAKDQVALGRPHLFPGARKGQPLSNMAMLECLRGFRPKGETVHGLRAAFSTWARENELLPVLRTPS